MAKGIADPQEYEGQLHPPPRMFKEGKKKGEKEKMAKEKGEKEGKISQMLYAAKQCIQRAYLIYPLFTLFI